ncbi:oligosaccharide flippase family protein [Porticoccaceae bacterium]|nr:oligosaccharide flippase family protein [Porticoccaceae bacterium]
MNSKITSLLIKATSIILGFLSNFYLASILTKNDFGLYGALISLFSICLVFSNMGISLSVIDLFPKIQAKENILQLRRKIALFSIISSLCVGLIAATYATVFELISLENYFVNSVLSVIFIIFFQNIHASNIATLRSLQSFRVALTLESIVFNLTFVLAIYVLYLSHSYQLLYSFLLASLITFILSSHLTRTRVNNFEEDISRNGIFDFKELKISELLPFMALGFAEVITTNLDVLLVREFFGNEETASYFIAKKMLIAFTLFWFIYNFIYTPKLSKLFFDKSNINHKEIVRIMRLKWLVLVLTTIFIVPVNIFFNDVVQYLGLASYKNAKSYLMLFSLFALIHIITGPVISFLNVSGLSKYSVKVVMCGAVVFLISFYPLQYFYGALGILIALNLSLLAWKIVGIYVVKRETGFNIFIGSYVSG